MSENRFKVSKANSDGTKETKETYRRVNLSTDIQVNIIEPCKCTSRDSKWTVTTTCSKIFFMSHISCYVLRYSRVGLCFLRSLSEKGRHKHEIAVFSHPWKQRITSCLLFVAPGGTANRQANCVAEKAGNLALYEVKLVHIIPSNL